MATATPNKTLQTDLLPMQAVAANTVVTSAAFDLSGKIGAAIFVRFGRASASSGVASAFIRIEASSRDSADNSWNTIGTIPTNFAACEGEAVSGVVNAGATVITVASTTNLTAGDVICIYNASAPANSCFARVKSVVTNTSITVEDALVNAATGCTIYDSAEIMNTFEIGSTYKRLRAVFDGSQFTQASLIQVSLITLDSMTIT